MVRDRKSFRMVTRTVAALGLGIILASSTVYAQAIIDNGTVQLGVDRLGQLNIGGGTPSLQGNTIVGLRFLPTTAEATADGCLCEGWGVAIASTGERGFANNAAGIGGLASVSFTATASTAVSTVATTNLLVTHDFHPSASPNLYAVDVTITNSGGVVGDGSATDLRYRRLMDWDIEPTAFSEFVTIQGHPAANLLATTDDGFRSGDPLSAAGGIIAPANTNFTDSGPADHGALFDFGFSLPAAGQSQTFTIFYGAAATEAEALAALGVVGAEVYSLGQCTPSGLNGCDPTTGTPNTFIFAFEGVGGTPVPNPVPEPTSMVLLGSGLVGLVTWRMRRRV